MYLMHFVNDRDGKEYVVLTERHDADVFLEDGYRLESKTYLLDKLPGTLPTERCLYPE